jgi:hypothetical protein
MVKIVLDLVSNGVIKTVIDNNINGAGDLFERRTVYNFQDDLNFEKRISFLTELCEELGIDRGNIFKNSTLEFNIDWGQNYLPETDEINTKIKKLTSELKQLKALKEILKNESDEI